MNILFIERDFLPTIGGVERVTYVLGEALRKTGHVVYYAFYGQDDDSLVADYKLHFNQHDSDELIMTAFKNFINTNNIEILICQNIHIPRFQKIYKSLKSTCEIKIITCLHGSPDMWVNKNKWGCTFVRIYFKELLRSLLFKLEGNPYKVNQVGMYELTDKYVLLSKAFKPVFCRLNDVDGRKLTAIPNPCPFMDLATTDDIRKEKTVLVVSRMAEQQKRISNVLQMWHVLADEYPDWDLKIVGDGPDLKTYKSMASKMHLPRISFTGSSRTPQDYYKKAKIFMMTSIWEGFGMTLIEAQYYGCVPLAYDSYAAVHDIIQDGENGFIIPLHDKCEYINKMSLLMKD